MRTPGDNAQTPRRLGVLAMAAITGAIAAIWLVAGDAGAQIPVPTPDTPTTLPPGAPLLDPSPPTPAPPPGQPGAPEPLRTVQGPTTTTTVAPEAPAGQLKVAGSASSGADRPDGAGSGPPRAPGLDLSELSALRAAALGKGPRPTMPDGGYDPSLPFQPARASQSGEEPEELGTEESEEDKVRSLGAVAAGTMAGVLLLLVRWVLRQAGPATG